MNDIINRGPHDVWRVNTDFLSMDYDDRMLSTNSPFKTRDDAEKAYAAACNLFCVDKPDTPARVTLEKVHFPGRWEMGTTTIIKQNYK